MEPVVFSHIVNSTLQWVTVALDAPSARAVVSGVHIGGHLFVEGLLLVVILFLLSQKSCKPPKQPLTKKEIDDLCEEWVPEPLITPITEDMQHEPPVLESVVGPHTIISGKEVLNFASTNYLGLIWNHAPPHWKNMVSVHVVLVDSMEQLMSTLTVRLE